MPWFHVLCNHYGSPFNDREKRVLSFLSMTEQRPKIRKGGTLENKWFLESRNIVQNRTWSLLLGCSRNLLAFQAKHAEFIYNKIVVVLQRDSLTRYFIVIWLHPPLFVMMMTLTVPLLFFLANLLMTNFLTAFVTEHILSRVRLLTVCSESLTIFALFLWMTQFRA